MPQAEYANAEDTDAGIAKAGDTDIGSAKTVGTDSGYADVEGADAGYADVEGELKRAALLVGEEMRRILGARNADRSGYEKLKDAMEYSLFAGGKRVRPCLCLQFCRAYGGSDKQALPYAAALEFMHTASLIHDDLPAMDDDDFRRGRPSCHRQFGEYTALLAGDALMIESFGALCRNPFCSAEQNAAAVRVLADCAGLDGMCGGQQLDLFCEGRAAGVETVEKTHLLKTAAMMSASAKLGCVAASATARQTEAAGRFGEALGLAFQIRDDILDETGRAESLGKAVGSDAKRGKNTYVSAAGMERARLKAEALTSEAADIAEAIGGQSGFALGRLCKYLLFRIK